MKKKKDIPIDISVGREDGALQPYTYIYLNIDCNDLIDWYDYHDAPSSISWEPTLEELIILKQKVDNAISGIRKLMVKEIKEEVFMKEIK